MTTKELKAVMASIINSEESAQFSEALKKVIGKFAAFSLTKVVEGTGGKDDEMQTTLAIVLVGGYIESTLKNAYGKKT